MDDPSMMVEVAKESGPLGVLILVLGALVRQWLAGVRADVKAAREASAGTADKLFELIGAVKKEVDEIKSELIADLRERVATLEAKLS